MALTGAWRRANGKRSWPTWSGQRDERLAVLAELSRLQDRVCAEADADTTVSEELDQLVEALLGGSPADGDPAAPAALPGPRGD